MFVNRRLRAARRYGAPIMSSVIMSAAAAAAESVHAKRLAVSQQAVGRCRNKRGSGAS